MTLLYRKSLVAVAAPLAAASLSAPAIAASQDEGTGAEEVDASHEVECRRMAAATGSRVGTRSVCKTQLEWAQFEEDAQNTVRRQSVRIPRDEPDRSHFPRDPAARARFEGFPDTRPN